jgi:hypothetical protein
MIEHRATKPLERHTLLVQHDEDQRPRFLAQDVAVGGRARKVLLTKLCNRHNQPLRQNKRGIAADLSVNLPRHSRASLYVKSPI